MTIGATLQYGKLLIVVAAPTRGRAKLEVADNVEAARLERVVRKKTDVAILAIGAGDALHAKQVGKHLCGCRGSVSVLTIVPILDDHNAERDGNRVLSKLLQMEAEVQVLHLDLLADDVV